MKILITGGNGYIARSLKKLLSGHEITSISRDDFDLTDNFATNYFFKNKHFDVVIHTAVKGGSRLKEDDLTIVRYNWTMFDNLIENSSHFDKFINIGSGIELDLDDKTPYGCSKKLIADKISQLNNFYNLRVFGVFNEDELDTRFIKSNVIRYINKEPMLIHQNKLMDYMYMDDFVKIVDYYINNNDLPKTVDCVYESYITLWQITMIINSLSVYKVEIKLDNIYFGKQYKGKNSLNLDFVGLEDGIVNVYNKLKI